MEEEKFAKENFLTRVGLEPTPVSRPGYSAKEDLNLALLNVRILVVIELV